MNDLLRALARNTPAFGGPHPHATHPCEAVGVTQIADRLDTVPETVASWKLRATKAGPPAKRGRPRREPMPAADWPVSDRPAWCWPHTIRPWAERVGLLADQDEAEIHHRDDDPRNTEREKQR
jgi:hypothetical protein